ncbi:alpha/beta hydrolase family protein [Oleiharenicola lentus]|uniref:alpha/beta hydrolase family protein n=1 Tax=Oleiharenicola lentus TaxID=2508720 RepID=UPI003F67AA27
MVHGGPWDNRDYGVFDPEVQFYATRGYAVLQVNFRMSAGYGRQLEALGKKQLGRTMQTDLDDSVDWAIAQGIADPKCLLIAGGAYGGYATLMCLIQNPSRFRAGIAMFPLTDLVQQLTDFQDDAKQYSREDWRILNIENFKKHVGDPAVERSEMEAHSPNNQIAKIQAPVFLVYGPEDEVIDKRQVRKFIDRMRTQKKKLVHFAPREEGHGITNEKRRLKVYTELEKFLAEYAPAR